MKIEKVTYSFRHTSLNGLAETVSLTATLDKSTDSSDGTLQQLRAEGRSLIRQMDAEDQWLKAKEERG